MALEAAHLEAGETRSYRVLIVEDPAFTPRSIAPILLPHCDVEIVGIASDLADTVLSANRCLPDVAIVNLAIQLVAIRIVRDLRERTDTMRILAVVDHDKAAAAPVLRHVGANDVVIGSPCAEDLVDAIRQVAHLDRNETLGHVISAQTGSD